MKKIYILAAVALLVIFGTAFVASSTSQAVAGGCSGCYYECNLETGEWLRCCYYRGCKAFCYWTGLYCA